MKVITNVEFSAQESNTLYEAHCILMKVLDVIDEDEKKLVVVDGTTNWNYESIANTDDILLAFAHSKITVE